MYLALAVIFGNLSGVLMNVVRPLAEGWDHWAPKGSGVPLHVYVLSFGIPSNAKKCKKMYVI